MSTNWESTFQSWAKPPGQTEQSKCDNAETAIKKAIKASSSLDSRTIRVFPQGSYRNRTNVRQDSDVDICVLCTDVCFVDYSMSEGLTDADVGLTSHPYTYTQFKNDVEEALQSYFGRNAVTRGNKAFDVHENTYRVDADVVACFKHRRYMGRPGDYYFLSGTQFRPDNGDSIVNWPEENYDNGVKKNKSSHQRFKSVVRILKRLRNDMEDDNISAAKPISSFLLECLVGNVPNEGFGHPSYAADVRWAVAHLFNNTKKFEDCQEWGEINDLKYLFRSSQPWTLSQANTFLDAARNYIGFE